ncbi:MAG: thiamine pyrophosphate-requiring protein [Proteobacteria bacterium]|nr:thiamine pyrophosphate-requiring protein [Pseudomonadota bacterium]
MYTASSALLEALTEAGVSCVFVNLGSDHPALVEAIAAARAAGKPIPRIITCPFEMVGLTAAHGHALVSGRPQAVVVHVECGTQSLAGAVHNAARGRIPALIYAGLSPVTQDGEVKGSRNEFIHWLQDIHDQRGLVREYMKYTNEIRSASNVKQIVNRALQFATSDPQGPVYLVGAREVMEQQAEPVVLDPARWQPVRPAALPEIDAVEIVRALEGARRPLLVTTFVGRDPAAVPELIKLCERLGVAVLESVPCAMNFPHDHPLYQGSHWNDPCQNATLAEADVVLVIDSDVPWIPAVSRPHPEAQILHIDIDPLKASMPLWYIGAERSYRANGLTALRQLNAAAQALSVDERRRAERQAHYAQAHARRAIQLCDAEAPAEHISTQYLVAMLRRLAGEDAILLSEGITNYPQIADHWAPTRPGSYFASGGGSLGWNSGAAIGAKLAAPDSTVIAIGGDGCFLFSAPSSVYWMARRYDTPFLQIVLNNGGWCAPRFSTLAVHPDGHAARTPDLDLSFEPAPDYGGIAEAAGGAKAIAVRRSAEVEPAIREALKVVREQRRCAVLDVTIPPPGD